MSALTDLDVILEFVARLAASPLPELQRNAIAVAQRYRNAILAGPGGEPAAPDDEAEARAAAVGKVVP